MKLLHYFAKPLLQKHQQTLRTAMYVGAGAGFVAGWFVGRKVGEPLALGVLGGVGLGYWARHSALAKDFADEQTKHLEATERPRLIAQIAKLSIPQACLAPLRTEQLYALDYFLQNKPKDLCEVAARAVLLAEIETYHAQLFEFLRQ